MERLAVTRHPLGSRARVLLTSVFGPYARDDEHGSRAINPMELYHNQVTRVQGPFSLRMFHRSWGLMLIQANLERPVTLLDFPTLERFEEEIRTVPYDVVGISGILPNVGKVKLMCELVRRHQPRATIVVGGHIANRPGLRDVVDADHVVAGEGVSWFRAFLGEDHGRAGPASAHRLRARRADDGRALRPGRGRDGGHRDPVGRLPARLQLLLDLGDVRGQGPLRQLLRGRRRALRGDAGPRGGAEDALLLRDGRELPPPPQARRCACWS